MEKYAGKPTGTVFLKWEKTEVSIWETTSAQRKDGLKEIRFDKVYLSVDEKRDRQVIAGIGQDIE